MRKIINILIIVIAILCLVGCEDQTTDGPGTGGGEEPVEYPYMDYFENTVYAMKYGGKTEGFPPTHGTFRDDLFAAVGQAKMSDVTADTPYSFNDKDYGGLCFTAKTGIEVESVTFTLVAEKECYLRVYFFGPELDENGNPIDGGISNVSSVANISALGHHTQYNFQTVDGSKLIKLSPNEPITLTIQSIREDDKTSAIDFGTITESCADDDTYRRFLISFMPFFINEGYLGSNYLYPDFTRAKLGLRIYNVSFDVHKL